jgi:hypothetical protein
MCLCLFVSVTRSFQLWRLPCPGMCGTLKDVKRFRQCERLSDWNSAGFFLTIHSIRFQYVFPLYWVSFTPSFR